MKRDAIDFHAVRFAHEPIHERLLNWARYVRGGGGGSSCMPMFRLYRAPDTWHEATPHIPIDSLDGSRIEKAVRALPEKHMAAIRWSYVYSARGMSIWRVCRAIGVRPGTLSELVHDARSMLKNRIV